MSAVLLVALATLRQIARHRIALVLFLVLPPVFLGVVVLTSNATESFGFTLPAIDDALMLFASAREITLLFVAIAAGGLFSTFSALTAMQANRPADVRLALAGLGAPTLVVGRALAVVVVSALVALLTGALIAPFLPSTNLALMALSLFAGALVYGAFGLFVGALVDGQLEGIIVTALLVQLDAGWLQNPVYYAGALHTGILHVLPAYLPSQAALAAAFGGPGPWAPLGLALLYALALFVLAVVVARVRLPRGRRPM